MADNLVLQYGSWMLLVVFLGSAVDLCQALWIAKRMWKRRQRAVEAKAMQKALSVLYTQGRLKGNEDN